VPADAEEQGVVVRRGRRAFQFALGIPWAMTEESIEEVLQIAARENPSPEAIEAKYGRELGDTAHVTVRDGIATVRVRGPIFRYGNLFTRMSGASSYQVLATDFTTALEEPQVKAILLAVDSPGGMVNGCEELAELIYKARGMKPIVAHVSGAGTSAAYWLASAADEIVAGKTAELGSIGVRATYTDFRDWEEKQGIRTYEFISSQSPKKKFDPREDDSRARLQRTLDDLAAVFIGALARNRGITPEQVIESYGAGDVIVGAAAVEAGLADRLGTYEEVHAELAEQTSAGSVLFTGGSAANHEETKMAEEAAKTETPDALAPKLTAEQIEADYPEFVAEWRKQGADREYARLAAIDALAEPGHEDLIKACKADRDCTPETAAFRMKQAEKKEKAEGLEALKKDEAELDAPKPLASEATDPDSEAGTARRVLTAGKTEVHLKPAS
jgi:signal peptide peptidase SppA